MIPRSSRPRRALHALVTALTALALVASSATIATASVDETTAPTASLSGTVTDASTGAGIPDASLVVLDAAGAQAATVTTGSTGGYTVSGLTAGDYAISVSAAPVYEPVFWPTAQTLDAAERVTVAAGEARVGLDVALVPVVVPVADAAPEEPVEEVPADVPAAEEADAEEAESAVEGGKSEDPAAEAGDMSMFAVEATATGTISGTVTHESDGTPVSGVYIWVESVGVVAPGSYDYGSTSTAVDGSYEIQGLTPGSYSVWFRAQTSELSDEYWDGSSSWETASSVVVIAGSIVRGVDASLKATGAVSGRVTSEVDGMAIQGASVHIQGSRRSYFAVTGADGEYAVENLSVGEYVVRFYATGMAPEYWEGAYSVDSASLIRVLPADETRNVDASMVAGSTISGVVSRDGVPVAATVFTADGMSAATTDSQGRYTIDVGPGAHVLGVDAGSDSALARQYYDGAATAAEATPVTVASGEALTGIDFNLELGATIEGMITADSAPDPREPWATATAYRWGGDDWHEVRTVTGWGDYSFDQWYMSGGSGSLPSGQYAVGFTMPGFCSQFFDGASSLDTADRFDLAAGEVRTGINAHFTQNCATPAVTAGTPSITGIPTVGETLTAAPGEWAPAPVALTYQWLADGVAISGATASTLELTEAQEGARITVTVTGTRPGHTSATATSAEVGPVAAAPLPPVVAGTPSITGTPTAGRTLTADPGTWAPADVTLSYQWLADGAPIPAATGATFVAGDAEVGKTLTVTVTGTKAGHTPASATSAPFGPIVAAPLLDLTVGTPVISGTPQAGKTLALAPGNWGPGTVDFAYQWQIDGVDIVGATGDTLVLDASTVGKTVTATVRGSKPGYNTQTADAAGVGPVAAGEISASTPTITGTPRVDSPLTAEPGEWGPAPVDLAYQWAVDGIPVPGATGAQFTPTATDAGKTVTVTVTGTKPGYTPESRTSTATDEVALGILSPGQPTITGEAGVGKELRVSPGSWGPALVDFEYEWIVDGEPIEGATTDRFTPDASLVGAEVTVRVTGTKPGYVPVERTTAATLVPPTVTVSAPRAPLGGEVVVTGEHFLPGEDVALALHSDPFALTTVTADEDGAFTTTVTIPKTATVGAHRIVATGVTSGLSGSAAIEVYDPVATNPGGGGTTAPGGGTGGGGLATTGTELPLGTLLLSILLLALGGAIAWRRRVV